MDHADKIAFKQRLKRWALDTIGQRITASREAIDQAQQAANQEEKAPPAINMRPAAPWDTCKRICTPASWQNR